MVRFSVEKTQDEFKWFSDKSFLSLEVTHVRKKTQLYIKEDFRTYVDKSTFAGLARLRNYIKNINLILCKFVIPLQPS